jgi:hypothetical protein
MLHRKFAIDLSGSRSKNTRYGKIKHFSVNQAGYNLDFLSAPPYTSIVLAD